ncbi:hypothetical protein [Actinacidiphila epipremni]|uniref:Uncharacterized protein n=1 Tax=Actinacidiphila epipremni TaxID=2053013 RepID=A0ABX0ZUK8_9ACTN|nr:hypothetical protein [Actinacidiphila epipremni]NJP47689.1 hypothetical protein [Actinacidiphila epipremni]
MRKGLAAAGVVALITAGAAACGSDEPSTPQGKVSNAFTKLGEQKSVTLGLSFDATAQQIYAAMKDEDDFELADAKMLAGLSVKAGFSSDKPLAELKSKDKGSSVGLQVLSGASNGKGGKPLAGVRSVGQKVYLQVDLKGIASLDPDNSELSDINDLLASVDSMPSSFASVKALAKGGWVSVDPEAFGEFFKTLGKDDTGSGDTGSDGSSDDGAGSPLDGLGLPSGLPTGLPTDLADKTLAQLLAPLQQSLTRDAKLTDLGSHDGADHVKATIPARTLVKDLEGGLGSLAGQLPGRMSKDLQDVPDKPVDLDLAIKDGTLSHITLDMAQLDDTVHGKLPLDMSLDGGAAPVEAPKGAQPLNPQDLVGLVMAQLGGLGGDDDA